MTRDQLDASLKTLGVKDEKEGFLTVQEGGSLTLYVASGGSTLTIPRVEAVHSDGELLFARTSKKEIFAVVREDLFAVCAEGTGATPARRPAGFG